MPDLTEKRLSMTSCTSTKSANWYGQPIHWIRFLSNTCGATWAANSDPTLPQQLTWTSCTNFCSEMAGHSQVTLGTLTASMCQKCFTYIQANGGRSLDSDCLCNVTFWFGKMGWCHLNLKKYLLKWLRSIKFFDNQLLTVMLWFIVTVCVFLSWNCK